MWHTVSQIREPVFDAPANTVRVLPACMIKRCACVLSGRCATVSTFVNLPWGYKLLYGLLADCVPICGLHRKPYMIIGWACTFGISLAFALLPTVKWARTPLGTLELR